MEEKQQFESDRISFTVEKQKGCIVKYKVKTRPKIAQETHKQAIRSIAKEVSLPGFRKGKAPDHLIAKNYPKPLKERWQKALADKIFQECQNLAKIPLIHQEAQINFHVESLSKTEGAELTYTFETEPFVPSIEIKNIQLKKIEKKVIDEKKINDTLHRIQLFFATFEKISDRNVQKGDFVNVDVDVIEQDPPKRALTNTRFEVKKEKMAKWMLDLVIDMKIGETKEGTSIPDEDVSEEHKKESPPKKVRLMLRNIEKAFLPPLDNELAKKMGVKTVEELKENLEKLLNKQADEHVQKHYREEINAYLIENYPLDLPQSLINKEAQYRFKQLATDPTFQKRLLDMSEEERKKAIEDIKIQGEKAVRLFYIARKLVEENKINISPNEIHQEVKTPLEALFSEQSDNYNAKESSQEQKAIAMSRLLLTKAQDFLIDKATFVADLPKEKPETSSSQAKTPPEKKASKAKETHAKKEPKAGKKEKPQKKVKEKKDKS